MEDDLTRNLPSPEGEALGAELARLTEPGIARTKQRFPDAPGPCKSCAFRHGTVPNRCLATVADALKCVMEQVPFYCHEAPHGGTPTQLCRGYAAALSLLPAEAEPLEVPWDYSHPASAPKAVRRRTDPAVAVKSMRQREARRRGGRG